MDGATLTQTVKVVDWEQRWSNEARRKQMPTLQGIVSKYQGAPGMISMHGGLPPPDAFPFTAFECSLERSSNGGSSNSSQEAALPPPAAAGGTLSISDPSLVAAAQQYNMHAKGYPPLQAWARDLVCQMHKPPATLSSTTTTAQQGSAPIGIDVAITSGSSAALDALARVLFNPGDPVLLEEYTYNHHAEAHLLPLGCELVPVHLDQDGLIPCHLDAIMTQRAAAGLTLPRVLYTIPTGQNPTGACLTYERMVQVYALARKWDLVVIEDDAYYWLQYPHGPDSVPGLSLRPGFLSLDVDGRVVRLDTLAKLLGPGFRLGWLSGPPALVGKVALYLAAVSVGASSLSQVLIHQLLVRWGRQGLEDFVGQLQRRYAQQAAVADAAAAQHLAGLAEWQPVKAGMFMFIKMTGAGADSSSLMELGSAEGVMVIPGHLSSVPHLQAAARSKQQQQQEEGPAGTAKGQQQQQQQVAEVALAPCPFFRVSFASVGSDEALTEGFARLKRTLLRCKGLSCDGVV